MEHLCIEIIKTDKCTISNEKLIEHCVEYLQSLDSTRRCVPKPLNGPLAELIEHIIIDSNKNDRELKAVIDNVQIKWFIYSLDKFGGQQDILENERDSEVVTLSTNWILPSHDFHGLWDTLIFDHSIKDDLLQYVSTMMLFSDKGVDANIVCSNRVVLLHGPPGTGKTSLCKALAHKLAIRLQHRYKQGYLIEINSHSLFSKWFSESGKLVSKMFSKIYEMIEDSSTLICVLIDEVESLAHARSQCLSGNEPSDSIRVVNSVLTHIDQIKRYPNVLIFTTSNMTAAIDLAFVDRADIKKYIGIPSIEAIFHIYLSCLRELMRTGIIQPSLFWEQPSSYEKLKIDAGDDSLPFLSICESSVGFSGRTLRKVPFIAHALYIKTSSVHLNDFLEAMSLAVDYLKIERTLFET